MGYHRAGFDVVGVDIAPQPRYPFEFHQADALTYPLGGFDAIHASPPCQAYSQATLSQRRSGREYPDLIAPTRARLGKSGVPWVLENVPGAPLRPDHALCGCMFGLAIEGIGQLRRQRWFELSWPPRNLLPPHSHVGPAISIAGHGTPAWMRERTGHVEVALWRQVMGIDWMTREELTESIPPAYTEYVGRELLDHLAAERAS